nr:MBL fold metallo-hydrolase [Acididesulfobacillus acetoxydans]
MRALEIRWLGHSCFLFVGQEGVSVLTDPFDQSVGYPTPKAETDVVTISHHHFDHDAVQVLPGKPQVIEGPGRQTAAGLTFKGTATFHDAERGAKRGQNTVFSFTLDGVSVVHLGDLGHLLTPEQREGIGTVDIVCVPVGGFYTIDAGQAYETVQQLNPKVILPMHYKPDEAVTLPIAGVDDFLQHFTQVKKAKTLEISRASLPQTQEVVVLEFSAPGK